MKKQKKGRNNRISLKVNDETYKSIRPYINKYKFSELLEDMVYAYLSDEGIEFFLKQKGIIPMQLDITEYLLKNITKLKGHTADGIKFNFISDGLEFYIDLVYVLEFDVYTNAIRLAFENDNCHRSKDVDNEIHKALRMHYDKIGDALFYNNMHIL